MVLPIRSSQCNHVQCFDAATFLQMNEKKPTWLCPVCDKPAEFKTLVVDGWVSFKLYAGMTVKEDVSLNITLRECVHTLYMVKLLYCV